MKVHISFTLDVDRDEWLGRPYFGTQLPPEALAPEAGGGIDDEVVRQEVAYHAEQVVRGLYEDQGWLIETPPAVPVCHWTGKPKGECGCNSYCPSCMRRRHDSATPKCYLC